MRHERGGGHTSTPATSGDFLDTCHRSERVSGERRPVSNGQKCLPETVHILIRDCLSPLWPLLLLVLSVLLTVLFQFMLRKMGSYFPAPIIAMVVVFVLMYAAGMLWKKVDAFYEETLKEPTNLLNRHMSIGFTIPFVMIAGRPTADSKQIGLMIACYVVTGILNCIVSYGMAWAFQSLLVRLNPGQRRNQQHLDAKDRTTPDQDPERNPPETGSPRSARLSVPVHERSRKGISNASTLTNNGEGTVSHLEPPERVCPDKFRNRSQSIHCLLTIALASEYFPSLLCLLGFLVVGIPVAVSTKNDAALDTFFLFMLWFGTLAVQSKVKTTKRIHLFANIHHLQAVVATLLNAVLITSLAMIAYVVAKSAAKHTSASETLSTFLTDQSLVDIVGGTNKQPATNALGAGDVALMVLDAGIVSWGFKLYEYRAQLLSHAGLTVAVVCVVVAAFNVALGPLLAHAVGLPAGQALAFAARSATIALGRPALEGLARYGPVARPDQALNAAMVVVNGVLCQMAGDWVGRGEAIRGGEGMPRQAAAENSGTDDARDQAEAVTLAAEQKAVGGMADQPRVVATGIAVGINAAAMGTSHLYERQSDSAPYAALAMTVLGVATVGLASVPGLAVWVVRGVGA